MSFELEVCVDQIDHALRAADAGATRIEFNQALRLDGLTPSPGLCACLVEQCPVPVIAMLRPHANGFFYSRTEAKAIVRDAECLLQTGLAGLAFGALTSDGQIDVDLLEQVSAKCVGKELVFHRAFDEMGAPLAPLQSLIACGVHRLLTSGGAETALQGSPNLRRLQQRSAGRLEILPGAGIRSHSLKKLWVDTGCRQFHGSFSRPGGGPDLDEIRLARAILEELSAESS